MPSLDRRDVPGAVLSVVAFALALALVLMATP